GVDRCTAVVARFATLGASVGMGEHPLEPGPVVLPGQALELQFSADPSGRGDLEGRCCCGGVAVDDLPWVFPAPLECTQEVHLGHDLDVLPRVLQLECSAGPTGHVFTRAQDGRVEVPDHQDVGAPGGVLLGDAT